MSTSRCSNVLSFKIDSDAIGPSDDGLRVFPVRNDHLPLAAVESRTRYAVESVDRGKGGEEGKPLRSVLDINDELTLGK